MDWLGMQELRKATGITAKEVAQKIGKDATYVSKIEKGNILNTSYDIVMSIAQVIANTEAIQSGEIDLNDYDSEFSRLVLSCRFAYMKDVYDYVKENKEVEEYSKIIRNLNNDDLNTFRAVISHRRAEKRYTKIKDDFKRRILKQSKTKSIKKYFKNLRNENEKIILKIKVDTEDFIEENFDESINWILSEIEDYISRLEMYGLEEIADESEGKCFNQDEEIEIDLPEPE